MKGSPPLRPKGVRDLLGHLSGLHFAAAILFSAYTYTASTVAATKPTNPEGCN